MSDSIVVDKLYSIISQISETQIEIYIHKCIYQQKKKKEKSAMKYDCTIACCYFFTEIQC